jgi:prepilin-type N-terminal cleavage/methylation domain-containing protein
MVSWQEIIQRADARGFTLIELLLALGLTGIIMTMTLGALFNNPPQKRWGRMVEDYATHLAATYNTYQLQRGWPLINASNTNGLAGLLPTTESGITYVSSNPEYVQYQAGFRVYLRPEQLSATVTGITNPILPNTLPREWLLLDLDPNTAPTNLTQPDLVLLRVDNTTGQVLTAHQVASGIYSESFYDTFKGY